MDNFSVKIDRIDKNNVSEDEKQTLFRLLQLSEYDFSEFISTDVNDEGIYEYDYFDCYFTDEDRFIFTLKVNGKYAGIALINNYAYVIKSENAICMAEFFILKKYRRKGFGKLFVYKIFDSLRGDWELFQHKVNTIALKFWTTIIGEYTNGNYKAIDITNDDGFEGKVFIFNNVLVSEKNDYNS
jgi:predicted acetyltransferase